MAAPKVLWWSIIMSFMASFQHSQFSNHHCLIQEEPKFPSIYADVFQRLRLKSSAIVWLDISYLLVCQSFCHCKAANAKRHWADQRLSKQVMFRVKRLRVLTPHHKTPLMAFLVGNHMNLSSFSSFPGQGTFKYNFISLWMVLLFEWSLTKQLRWTSRHKK